MALISSYVHPTIGCTINVYDDCCLCSNEEMQERYRVFTGVLSEIYADPEVRMRLAQYNAEHYAEGELS